MNLSQRQSTNKPDSKDPNRLRTHLHPYFLKQRHYYALLSLCKFYSTIFPSFFYSHQHNKIQPTHSLFIRIIYPRHRFPVLIDALTQQLPMVKYGYCKILCTACNSGLAVRTNIQRDSNWETAIHTHTCRHFHFACDLYTYDSFNPYKDSVGFRARVRCLTCSVESADEISCKGFENRHSEVSRECHGNRALCEFRLDSNTGSDYALNTLLYSFGLYGTLAKYISKKIGEHLELFVIGDGVEDELSSDEEMRRIGDDDTIG